MSSSSSISASNLQTTKEMISEETEGQNTTEQNDIMMKLQDELKQAKAESENQKKIMESYILQFQKERESWICREKELLNKVISSESSTTEATLKEDEVKTLESALKYNQEELKNAREELKKAQDKIDTLETSLKCSGNVSKNKKNSKHQSEKDASQPSNSMSEEGLRKENEKLRAALTTAVARLKDKTMRATSMEQQNVQLRAQVVSLKEVTGITKDLLGIRNSEVEHLRGEMEAVEAKIQAERDQRAQAIERVEKATRLNANLKKEYEFQLSTFKKLKSKYEEKVELLASENRRLVAEANAEGRPGEALDVGPLITDDEEMPQH